LQKFTATSLNNVRDTTKTAWKNVFSLLRKESEGMVSGRSGDSQGGDLRKSLQRLADGKASREEIDELCREISCSPESVETLARLMLDAEREA